jgi:DinB superfamily
MASAEELRQAITSNRQKLREALSAARDRWESGDDSGWSPRAIAEHCIGREFGLGGIAAAAMLGEAADRRYTRTNGPGEASEFSFATAAEALSALEGTGAACDEAFQDVGDGDLGRPAELDAGDLPKNLEGVMRLTAWHLNDHAKQIAKA